VEEISIVSVFPVFTRQKACRYGTMLFNPNDTYIGRSLDLYGEFSEGEVDLFRQLVQPGQVVVEVGANIGAHTVVLAQLVGPRGRVLAFEPQRLLYQMLCANLALNNITNVVGVQQAVGAAHGTVNVPVLDPTMENNFGGVSVGPDESGEPVLMAPLDAYDLKACDFLKVDVEGMEEDVLRGAMGLISRCQPTLYVENDRPEKSDSLLRFIDALGYRIYRHWPLLYNDDNFYKNPNNIFPWIVSMNVLCVSNSRVGDVVGLEQIFPPPLAHPTSG
jgi:FkbM family methyltransferase